MWRLMPSGVSVHSARARLEEVTVEELLAMEKEVSYAARLLATASVDIIVFGCTTGSLVAGPGCYPTATLLGLLPFIPYIDTSAPVFVDAKSGVSGAGKKLSETSHFVTINDNIFAYNSLKHRHAPEIAEKIAKIHGAEVSVNFVPHLIPATRGELVSVYATLREEIDPEEVLDKAYGTERFIRLRHRPVDIKSVAGTHFCDIYAQRNGKALFISSAIDNLLRGAASQALAAANLMMGVDEGTALPVIAYVP